MGTITLKKVELPLEEKATRVKRWTSLGESIHNYDHVDRPFRICQRRGLEVVINTLEDGRAVVSIDGNVGAAKSLLSAFKRAASAWDKATKPKAARRKKR